MLKVDNPNNEEAPSFLTPSLKHQKSKFSGEREGRQVMKEEERKEEEREEEKREEEREEEGRIKRRERRVVG